MEIIARATAIFFFVWVVTRAIGKRQLSELSAFQLVLLVTIGDLVQNRRHGLVASCTCTPASDGFLTARRELIDD